MRIFKQEWLREQNKAELQELVDTMSKWWKCDNDEFVDVADCGAVTCLMEKGAPELEYNDDEDAVYYSEKYGIRYALEAVIDWIVNEDIKGDMERY